MAKQFGTNKSNISKNFKSNSERFIEGTHYYKLEVACLKAFKGYGLNDDTLKFTSILYVWTERGVGRHINKIINNRNNNNRC